MKTTILAAILAIGLAPVAIAQTTTPAPSTTPAPTTTTSGMPEQRFTDADKDRNGMLEGAELDAHRAVLSQVDKNNDGKLSRAEFLDGVKAGLIK